LARHPANATAEGTATPMKHDEALEIQKRLTLNWLIQGASQHAGMTFHHLVRDELNAMDPELIRLYDHFALIGLLQYWHLSATIIFGTPARFWKRAVSRLSRLPISFLRVAKRSRMQLAQRCKRWDAIIN
jgi:hypothetical protein